MTLFNPTLSRRNLLSGVALSGLGMVTQPLWAQTGAQGMVDLHLPGKPSKRPLTKAFPQKGEMILQRVRPPLLETPMQVFDQHILTPNDQFYVRWHWANIPESVDAKAFRLTVRGHVERKVELRLDDLLHGFERIEYVAVNQCSGNSRGLFSPSVAGAEWGHGAMGNARWTGVRLRDVLDRAGVKAGAVDVRFGGLDEALVSEGPKFLKSLAIDHARDGEVMIAYAMNGEPLPLLNGYPLRLIVPGWYSTYWVKMLSDIEVLPQKDDNFWMAKAYQVPKTPFGHVPPGTADFPKEPISRMVPRSLITNLAEGQVVKAGAPLAISGIAMGGDCGVAKVEISTDGGATWQTAALGEDLGPYSLRRFTHRITMPAGRFTLACRCTNTKGVSQPLTMNWNPGGYMRAGVETLTLVAGEKA
ncbi:molybdopterin-dependent oxidoreductase [Novosphingobium sp. SG707]|uniref:molybdopterin-dependent oxidoreductase n=1 Tax=Novosphingobium sp. SG707 TaxID=2586996 RepID=UPI00144702FA|nr:DMSO/TMAO reductase YedYZ molybdopterin-dependent catalytic subunit [Novosphingobium sp. SG707]